VVSIAGANLHLLAKAVEEDAAFARVAAAQFDAWSGPIRGPGGEALVREIVEAGARFDLLDRAPALARKPVMLVAGRRDVDTPPTLHHGPLFEALAKAHAAGLRGVELDADHAFSDHRVTLARAVAAWLDRSCH
jgi:pimeloyl-ACP methyl ester carboxylesterase